jgi:hypothetical protein
LANHLDFWLAVAIPLLAGAGMSFAVERVLEPVPALAERPWRSFAVHLGVWTIAFAAVLLVVQRPWFAALLLLAELLFLAIVSNRKVRALREPFVYQDFEYFTDVIRHPRLLLPYLGVVPALVVCAAFGAAIWLGVALEPGLPVRAGWPAFGAGTAAMAALGAALLWAGTAGPLPVTFRPAEDIRRHGQLASFWYYRLAERGRPALPETTRYSGAPARPAGGLPDIVIVQSESFFDARRLHAAVRPELLAEFDAVRRASAQWGYARVPAWGGNTARSEFAFLTGLRSDRLGVNLFNPYRKLAQQASVPTLAGLAKRAGYRTVCVHPYPVSFYSRDTAYPAIGFDEFLDLEEFREAERYGPYVSDAAVAARISRLLDRGSEPLLVFAITMENHGPLHLEKVAPGDVERLYTAPPPAGYEDLTVYLRHLANADGMIRALRERLERSKRDAWLAWYGDHVPILPRVYDATGYADGRTDYFIWGKGRGPAGAPVELRIEELGAALFEHAGLLEKP